MIVVALKQTYHKNFMNLPSALIKNVKFLKLKKYIYGFSWTSKIIGVFQKENSKCTYISVNTWFMDDKMKHEVGKAF